METEKRLKGIPNKCDSCVYITMELCFQNGEQHMKEKILNLIKEFECKFGAAATMTTTALRWEIEKL